MSAKSYWDGEGEVSYRSEWERAVNGNRSRGVSGPAQTQAWPPRQSQPQYPPQPQFQPPYQPQPEPAPANRGRRRATGFYVFLSWTALFAWAAFIYYMSAHTGSDLAQGIFAHIRAYIEEFVWRYYGYVEDPVSPICHFGEYFILGALLGNALHCHMPFIPATLLAIAVSSGYGYTDEIHQLSVAGRMFDLEDWKIDTIAAALGSFLMLFFFLIGSRRERR